MRLKEITIEITQQCPNCCVHCSSMSSTAKSSFLPIEIIERVIDDAVELGCQIVSLSGGEPFMYCDLLRLVNIIKERKLYIQIYTSGICMIENQQVSIPLAVLKELHGKVDKYIVNCEAADEETYDRVMGTSFHGFEKMQEFVHNVVAMGETVEAHFVPMKLNYKQIPEVVDLCAKLGVSKISFLRLVRQGRCMANSNQIIMDDGEQQQVYSLINECKNQKKIEVRTGIPLQKCVNRINCLTGSVKMVVRYDGNVYPCEAFKNDQPNHIAHASADNVKSFPLADIYRQSQYLNEVRSWLESFQDIDTCETCLAQYISSPK